MTSREIWWKIPTTGEVKSTLPPERIDGNSMRLRVFSTHKKHREREKEDTSWQAEKTCYSECECEGKCDEDWHDLGLSRAVRKTMVSVRSYKITTKSVFPKVAKQSVNLRLFNNVLHTLKSKNENVIFTWLYLKCFLLYYKHMELFWTFKITCIADIFGMGLIPFSRVYKYF